MLQAIYPSTVMSSQEVHCSSRPWRMAQLLLQSFPYAPIHGCVHPIWRWFRIHPETQVGRLGTPLVFATSGFVQPGYVGSLPSPTLVNCRNTKHYHFLNNPLFIHKAADCTQRHVDLKSLLHLCLELIEICSRGGKNHRNKLPGSKVSIYKTIELNIHLQVPESRFFSDQASSSHARSGLQLWDYALLFWL